MKSGAVIVSISPNNIFGAVLTAAILLLCFECRAQSRETVGWLERVRISPGSTVLRAKLDSGADYSSLNAAQLEEFEAGGKKWARFYIRSQSGDMVKIEQEIIRRALIKAHSGKRQSRVVVRLGICISATFMEADVNLVNRANFKYDLLIGRNFLAGNLVIDPSVSYTQEPRCTARAKKI